MSALPIAPQPTMPICVIEVSPPSFIVNGFLGQRGGDNW
jgi:hypothetical protein